MTEPYQQTATPSAVMRLKAFFINHAQVLISSLGRICRSPLASIMTISVLGIALALPCGFYTLLKNFQQVSGGWDGAARISLYLTDSTSKNEIETLKKALNKKAIVDDIRVIDKNQALEEFKMLSGFGDALDALDSNPLPTVMVITPVVNSNNPLVLESLVDELRNNPIVEFAQLDMQWIKRLYSITSLIQRGLVVIAAMLALAVILIIGNTIRLDIQNRRVEIEVNKLIGATNAFIRRPFLYTGFWYGLLGGVVACLLISVALSILRGPAQRLAGLYESNFQLFTINFLTILVLVCLSVILGLLGSWLAVGRHLREIEPG